MPNRLGELRRAQGITQSQMAGRIGITRPHLSDIENNKHEAAAWIWCKCASLLGVAVEDLQKREERQTTSAAQP